MTDTLVAGAGGVGVPAGTPGPGGVAGATPTQAPTDAELQRRIEEARAAAVAEARRENEVHLNRMKGSLQSQIANLEREREEERESMRQRLLVAQTAGMDDAKRVAFENQYFQERLEEYEGKVQELNGRLQEMEAQQAYLDWFAGLGVDASKLTRDQGLQALLQSGWEAVQSTVQDLRSKAEAAVASPAPAPVKPTPAPAGAVTPPAVVTDNAAPASVKVTWPELRQRFGYKPDDWTADEILYKKLERQEISKDAFPQE